MSPITYYLYTRYNNYSANEDFSNEVLSLTFFPGDSVGSPPRCISISILDDVIVESEEQYSVYLSSNSQALQTINTTAVNITIYDDPSDGELHLRQ